jgi:hypothetical protein
MIGAGTCLVCPSLAQDKQDNKDVNSALMQKKLEQAQKILEGLATEDFDSIAKNAKAMNGLTVLEQWFRAKEPDYQMQLKSFRFANQELIRLAEEGNIDGASVAYIQLTISCVNCHKYMRAK